MIYAEPKLSIDDDEVLAMIGRQRESLRIYSQNNPRRWLGTLRRMTLARAVQGSNSIEGYDASLDEAVAAIDGQPPLDKYTETWLALMGYQSALTYILQAVRDPTFEPSEQFLKTLHFMMLEHEMSKNPGLYRPGSVFVVRDRTNEVVYTGPDREIVGQAMAELVEYLRRQDSASPAEVRGAMAHLNLAMIHPFSDGNGRMARAVQTMVLAREAGLSDPIFASIEEWVGRNTESYYATLATIGKGRWNPTSDAAAWIRFCLIAHYQQAATVVRRNEEYSALYERIESLRAQHKLETRMLAPLFDAALGLTMNNERYRRATDVEPFTATRDLKALANLGLLVASGERRGRKYTRGQILVELRRASRSKRRDVDPYEVLREKESERSQRLPGL